MAEPDSVPDLAQQVCNAIKSKRIIREEEHRKLEAIEEAELSSLRELFAKKAEEVTWNVRNIRDHLKDTAQDERKQLKENHRLEKASMERRHEEEYVAAQHKLKKSLEVAERDKDDKHAVLRVDLAQKEQELETEQKDRIFKLGQKRKDEDDEEMRAWWKTITDDSGQSDAVTRSSAANPDPVAVWPEEHNSQSVTFSLSPKPKKSPLSPADTKTPAVFDQDANPKSSKKQRQRQNKEATTAPSHIPVATPISVNRLQLDRSPRPSTSSSSVKRKDGPTPQSDVESLSMADQDEVPKLNKNRRKRQRKAETDAEIQANSSATYQDSGRRNVSQDYLPKNSFVDHAFPKRKSDGSFSLTNTFPFNTPTDPKREQDRRPRSPESRFQSNERRPRSPSPSRRSYHSPDQATNSPQRGQLSWDSWMRSRTNDSLHETKDSHLTRVGRLNHLSTHQVPGLVDSSQNSSQRPVQETPEYSQTTSGGASGQQGTWIHWQQPLLAKLMEQPPRTDYLGPCQPSRPSQHSQQKDQNKTSSAPQPQSPWRSEFEKNGEFRLPPREPANFRRKSTTYKPKQNPEALQVTVPNPPLLAPFEPKAFPIKHIRCDNGTPAKAVLKIGPLKPDISLIFDPPSSSVKPSIEGIADRYPEFVIYLHELDAFELSFRRGLLVARRRAGRGAAQVLPENSTLIKENGLLGKSMPVLIEFLDEKTCRDFVGFCKNDMGLWQIPIGVKPEEEMLTQFRRHGWTGKN